MAQGNTPVIALKEATIVRTPMPYRISRSQDGTTLIPRCRGMVVDTYDAAHGFEPIVDRTRGEE